jgi:hypothetical protein
MKSVVLILARPELFASIDPHRSAFPGRKEIALDNLPQPTLLRGQLDTDLSKVKKENRPNPALYFKKMPNI